MTSKDAYDKLLEKHKELEEEFNIYRSLIENSTDVFYRVDMQGLVTFVSPSIFKVSGYTVQETLGLDLAKQVYLYPEQRIVFLEQLSQNGQVTNFEAQLKRKDGSIWWASINAKLFKDSQGNVLGNEGVARDISELKKAHQALVESEERFRMAFHTSPDSINLNRISDGLFLGINQGFTDQTGFTSEDVRGKTSPEINVWENIRDRDRMVSILKEKGQVKNYEARFLRKDGSVIHGLMSATILHINGEDVTLSITRDISDLKKAQEAMIQSEKMLSVGGLAAGMAHEINNPLAGMIQSSEVLLNRLSSTDLRANVAAAEELGIDMNLLKSYMEKRKILSAAEAIKQSGARIAKIVENMLGFARKNNDMMTSSHQITELLDKTIELASTDFDLKKHYDFKKIKIKKVYEKELPLIPCQANKLQQVFLNILSNGAQAMQEAQTLDPTFLLKVSMEKDSKTICLEITDNGPGMNKETQNRIFEPFFTTKPEGIGTGLGLSVSYFIITENHMGTMDVISEPGKGANFIVRLPIDRKN